MWRAQTTANTFVDNGGEDDDWETDPDFVVSNTTGYVQIEVNIFYIHD